STAIHEPSESSTTMSISSRPSNPDSEIHFELLLFERKHADHAPPVIQRIYRVCSAPEEAARRRLRAVLRQGRDLLNDVSAFVARRSGIAALATKQAGPQLCTS